MSEHTIDELKLLIEYNEWELDVITKRLEGYKARLKELESD